MKFMATKNFLPAKSTIRKAVLFIYVWLGLILGLYFTIIGLTGSVLVFQDNLEPLQTPEIAFVAPPVSNARLLPLSEIMARVHRDFPKATGQDLANVVLPNNAGGAYRLNINTQTPQTMRQITVDPYTGGVIRNVVYANMPFGFIHNVHVSLLMGPAGELANGYGAICVAFLLIFGLWLWWPATLRQLRVRLNVKGNWGRNRLIRNVHPVLGICSVLFLWMITLTGILLVFPKPVQKMIAGMGSAHSSGEPKLTAPMGAKRLPVDTLLAIARPVNSDVKISGFYYSSKPDQPFVCYKRSSASGFFPYTRIFINPYNGIILRIAEDGNASPNQKIPRLLRILHFGLWGGLFMKIIYSLAGLVPCGLFVTGILMYFRKWDGALKA